MGRGWGSQGRHFLAEYFRVAAGPGELVSVPCSRPGRREPSRARLRRRPWLFASFGWGVSGGSAGNTPLVRAGDRPVLSEMSLPLTQKPWRR
ncbi:Brefeldin A-inhibited guanine nucleotide-exchange protein 3 [Manis javanica]|nr:Brefeldin A-inhibited guanine nucleotide-exchange protein 3 [Manis javanica]